MLSILWLPAADAAATKPTTRPDPHLWARRNVDLIRQATARPVEPLASGGIGTTFGFSLGFNPLLVRHPYAAEILKIIEAAPRNDKKVTDMLDGYARFMRLPERERVLCQLVREMQDDPDDGESLDKPVVRANNIQNLISKLDGAPAGEAYDSIISQTLEQADAVAREAGKWGKLALSYQRLAQSALARGEPSKANTYIDRLLAIVREHPGFQNPARGNTDAVSPQGIAAILTQANRQRDLDALLTQVPKEHKLDVLLAMLDARLQKRDLAEARQVVEQQVPPLSPAAADRLLAALRGHATTLPATSPWITPAEIGAGFKAATQRHRTPPKHDAAELRLRGVLTNVALAHARRGDVETAARQWVALESDRIYQPAWGHLPSHRWAQLARYAQEGGHAAAARTAFDHALDELVRDPIVDKAGFEEKAEFVRNAIELGDLDLAYDLLQTTSAPGSWARRRLAAAYRTRGDAKRADELTEETLRVAREDRGGNVMTGIAVDLHAAGQVARAEKLLIDAINHIEGVDFGFSGTAAIVSAACRMNRLDLLDRCYQTYDDPGEKMLLCIVATHAGLYGAGGDEK